MHPVLERLAGEQKARYAAARGIATRLAGILVQRYQVQKVVLIGSLTQENLFDAHSDIDLCVAGLAPERYFEVVGDLLIEAGEFSVDVIRIEDASPTLKQQIESGEILYERT